MQHWWFNTGLCCKATRRSLGAAMTDPSPASSQAGLAADWATILHSEAAALAVDREVLEALQRAAAHLAHQAAALGAAWGAVAHDAAGCARPDAPPGATALADAPVAPLIQPAGLG